RGLKSRAGDLVAGDADAEAILDRALQAARALPGDGWLARLGAAPLVRNPTGPAEAFLALVRDQVFARASDVEDGYSLETTSRPADEALLATAKTLDHALGRLEEPLLELANKLV